MTDEMRHERTDEETTTGTDEGGGGGSPMFEPPLNTPEGEVGGPDYVPEEGPVGNENIAEGTVGGLMGSPHATQGQGQGG
jgi:hypothetical protein